jgi:hypothetical protein
MTCHPEAIVGTPNDYYLARVVVPADTSAAEAGALAQTLFARLATFYAS